MQCPLIALLAFTYHLLVLNIVEKSYTKNATAKDPEQWFSSWEILLGSHMSLGDYFRGDDCIYSNLTHVLSPIFSDFPNWGK